MVDGIGICFGQLVDVRLYQKCNQGIDSFFHCWTVEGTCISILQMQDCTFSFKELMCFVFLFSDHIMHCREKMSEEYSGKKLPSLKNQRIKVDISKMFLFHQIAQRCYKKSVEERSRKVVGSD